MTLKNLIIFTFLLATGTFSFAQKQDFNNYKTLQSVGIIPKDFNTSTADKIKADMAVKRENFTEEEQKEFANNIHNSVDELLQSGMITYGDEISLYVQKVAQKLLKDDEETFKKLRFYTLKSNITNALSTDQGIILVTTGLISQLTSEAELAYVLSHEIVHYTEKHAMEWYEFSNDKDVVRKIKEMSTYSKEREFEADAKGINMYLKAGYSKDYLTSLFDVLAYSYLPIDEIPFPETYFNSALCDIPKKKFPKEKYDIKMDENYDDRRSTHPNIKKRKEKALETADSLENWGTATNLLGLAEFEYIRDVARFERLRTDMLDKAYDQAIYTIFILEKKYPSSLFLSRMKSQAWYGLSVAKGNANDEFLEYEYEEEYYDEESFGFGKEGEIATLQGFLDKLNGIETATLAARVVQDCRKQFPEDPEIKELWNRTMKQLVINRKFEFEEFSPVTYNEYLKKTKEKNVEEGKVFSAEEWDKMTKYQKIRNKRKVAEETKVLDSTNYYLYNVSDVISDTEFVAIHEKYKDYEPDDYMSDFFEDYEFDDYEMTRREKRALRKERKNREKEENLYGEPVELSDILVVDPYVVQYEGNDIHPEKSEKLEAIFIEAFQEVAQNRQLTFATIGRAKLSEMNTETFNQKCLYISLMNQINQYMAKNTFPVDYSELLALEKDKENRKVIFVAMVNDFEEREYYDFDYGRPTLRSRIKAKFKKPQNASMFMIIMDPKTQEIAMQNRILFKKTTNKKDIREQLEKLLDTKVENEEEFEMDEEILEELETPSEENENTEEGEGN